MEDRTRVGAVGKQLAQERKLPEQGGQQQNTAVTILHVSGSDERVQQQTQLIDQNVTFLALNQLAGVKAMGIDR